MNFSDDLAAGARNLLVNCATLKAGESLLIVHEDPALGWYDLAAPQAIADEARELGMAPTLLQVGDPEDVSQSTRAHAASAGYDSVIFMARIGDQDRFEQTTDGKTRVMCYARDAAMLASAYGRTDHNALLELKEAVNDILLGAGHVDITCPQGTVFSGDVESPERESAADVSVRRFPMGVPQPLRANTFSGRVALARYLTPTGNRSYTPATLALDETVYVNVEAGRVTGYDGDAKTVAEVKQHYDTVSSFFGIDPDFVHSWHAGIHPGCAYEADAADDPDRWSNCVFTNPRFLHVHTCGAYAPGEICWMVKDPTISVDGAEMWKSGRLQTGAFAPLASCLAKWPELAALFAAPSDAIGLREPA